MKAIIVEPDARQDSRFHDGRALAGRGVEAHVRAVHAAAGGLQRVGVHVGAEKAAA